MVIIVEFAMMLMLLKAIMTIIMAMMTIRVTMMQMTAMIVFRVHGNDDSRHGSAGTVGITQLHL